MGQGLLLASRAAPPVPSGGQVSRRLFSREEASASEEHSAPLACASVREGHPITPLGSRRANRRWLSMLVLGGVIVILAALLAGISGFGLGIVAVPLLLLAGFSLPFIVTAVLLISLVTRVSVMWRLRRSINHRRTAVLIGAAVPGLFVGALFLESTDEDVLRIIVGTAVAFAAAALAFAQRYPPNPRVRGLNAAAGFAGGVLGTSTSLTGIPPALLLTRRGIPTKPFLADLATYFVATSAIDPAEGVLEYRWARSVDAIRAAIGLGALMLNGHFSQDGAEAFLWWLPGVIVANLLGTSVALRLPLRTFRTLVLGLAFIAGLATAATSL